MRQVYFQKKHVMVNKLIFQRKLDMKSLCNLFVFGVIIGYAMNVSAQPSSGINYKIKNQQAQHLYDALTGVSEDGAAGHIYKQGKSILCWHINADMNNSQGKPIPSNDPSRYACSIHFDKDGLASPGNRF